MHFDASAGLHELGLAPQPVDLSLAEAVAWFREVGWAEGL